MQRSFLVKSPVHFADFGFFVKIGDILVHDTSNANRLTVYRNGEVVKAIKQTTLGLAAMQKNGFIEEMTQQPKAAPKAPQKPVDATKAAPKRDESKVESAYPKPSPKPAMKKEEEQNTTVGQAIKAAEQKRKKATPVEVPFEELPSHLQALSNEREEAVKAKPKADLNEHAKDA